MALRSRSLSLSDTSSVEYEEALPGLKTPAPASPDLDAHIVEVTVHKSLGEGGHGKVAKATVGGELVALKQLPLSDPQTHRELDVVTKLRTAPHANIVQTHEPFVNGSAAYLPMELCEADLLCLVEQCGPLGERLARRVFAGIISALRHCHSLGIHHADVKPENILVCADGTAKLADFGSAVLAPTTTRPCATLLYGAPESVAVYMSLCYSGSGADALSKPSVYSCAAADVWSLGVSMIAVLSGFMPWELAHSTDARYADWLAAVAHYRGDADKLAAAAGMLMFGDDWQARVSPLLLGLLSSMVHPDPTRRITLEQVAAHPWFTGTTAPAKP